MKKSIVGLALVLFASLAWALPTVQQVEAETKQGHYAQAESMMAEVVAAKPDSAKAHYFYAELLAHNANFSKAAEETARAKLLDPKIGFADPAKFRAFEQTLQREQNPVPAARTNAARPAASFNPAPAAVPVETATRSGGIPGWVWLGGLAVLAIVLWRGFSRSRAQPAPAGFATAGGPANDGPGGMNQAPGYGPGAYGPGAYPQPARPGGGMLGTGLAVGAGVAGGMLIDEMLHRRNEGGNLGGGSNNIGGFDPEGYRPSSADQAATELENRPIDFGNGGDWDSGGGWD